MNDFNTSIAQQDVNITTETSITSVVGGNFYKAILYVTDRFESFGETTPVYPVVTRDTYENVIDSYAYLSADEKKLVKSNLLSLYKYGNVTVYIIPSSELANYKMKGYFVYLDLEWNTVASTDVTKDYTLADSAETTLETVASYDKDFTSLICDMPVDTVKMTGSSTTTTSGTLAQLTAEAIDIATFARPALSPSGTAGTVNAYFDASSDVISNSPCLYELGRVLGKLNESGTPIGNSFDMDAVTFLNVLPTANTSSDDLVGASAIMTKFFEDTKINYFKAVGNGTMQITNVGAWTILGNCIGAMWIVAYINYMNRIAVAQIITSGNAFKNKRTFDEIVMALRISIGPFISMGRVANFTVTATYNKLPQTDGHTITIPNAWNGVYIDNVRKVNISGAITIAA